MSPSELPLHHQVPGEIMSEIFIQYYGTDGAPWVTQKLSSICKTWLEIALKTPELWADIRIRSLVSVSIETISKAADWLKRSKTRPCSITLLIGDMAEVPITILPFLVLPVNDRIRRLDLSVPSSVLRPFASLLPFRMPKLDTLRIRAPFIISFPPNAFSSCPRVQHVALDFRDETMIEYADKLTMFPWENATDILLRNIPVRADAIYEAFCASPKVASCDITFRGWAAPVPPFLMHSSLALTTMRLSVVDSGLITPFLRSLRVPALTTLEIRGHAKLVDEDLSSTLLALHRNGPFQLTRLSIQDILTLRPEPLIEFFGLVPTIRSLVLSNCYGSLTEKFASMLVKYDNQAVLLPSLTRVIFSQQSLCTMTNETLLDFLTSRVLQLEDAEAESADMVAILERFQFSDGRIMDEETLEGFEVLVPAGLHLRIEGELRCCK
ncbi:hypothetical protein BDN72DRAFT_879932 [Pluteus cervinus]|uniref:Uncharacterized protein n=1 Tax=Pluteus cervinus TaxID=181527 RepID=A0ACD3AM52_9AGAR|nr:hypothetical protein BDN72DRAFT_879932 [Pluteus cervinus]